MTPARRTVRFSILWRFEYLLFVPVAALSLISCTSLTKYDAPDFGYSGLGDASSVLSLAALNAEYIKDIYSRDFLYSRLAEEYLRNGQNQLAREVLRRGTKIALSVASPEIRQQLLVELAKYYIRANDLRTATSLLGQALDLILSIDSEAQRGPSLQALIEVCFTIPESASEVLRTAIDYIYVLEDPVMRVQLLTDLGKKYQEINVRNRTNALVQQAIAAAVTISNPWSKAEAFSRIARRFKDEENEAEFTAYSTQAVTELNSVDIVAMSLGDAQSLLQTLNNLGESGYDREVSSIASRIPYIQIRIGALLALVERYLRQKSALQARLVVQRISKDVEGNADQDLIISTLVRLAEVYQNSGSPSDALTYIDATNSYLKTAATANTSPYIARIAILYLSMNRAEDALEMVDQIGDAYIASQTLSKIVGSAVISSKEAEARKLVDRAENLASQATYLRESALGAVALASFKLRFNEQALRILNQLQDPYIVGSVLVDANASHPAATWTAAERQELEKLRARWIRATL
jgi:hypothetical protein